MKRVNIRMPQFPGVNLTKLPVQVSDTHTDKPVWHPAPSTLKLRDETVVRKILFVMDLIIIELQITKSSHALEVICAGGRALLDKPILEIFELTSFSRNWTFAQGVSHYGISNG